MQFETLDPRLRELLLKALDYDINNLRCESCGEKTTYDKCCIMPAIDKKTKATILCDSTVCMSWYLTTKEEDEEENT